MEVVEPLRYCKYYKGENKCPYSLESAERTFWELEQTWVNIVNPSEEWKGTCLNECSQSKGLGYYHTKKCLEVITLEYE